VATWPYEEHTVGLWELRTQKTFSPDRYGGLPLLESCKVIQLGNYPDGAPSKQGDIFADFALSCG
jgi:hypothetical protein